MRQITRAARRSWPETHLDGVPCHGRVDGSRRHASDPNRHHLDINTLGASASGLMASAGPAVDADADGKPRGAGSPGSCENNENGNSLATSSTSFGMDGWSDDGSFEPPPRLLLDKFSDFVAAQPDKVRGYTQADARACPTCTAHSCCTCSCMRGVQVLFRFLTSRGTECDRLTYAVRSRGCMPQVACGAVFLLPCRF